MHSRILLVIVSFVLVNFAFAQSVLEGEVLKCNKSFGTLVLVESQNLSLSSLVQYDLESPLAMLRTIAEESACFNVVDLDTIRRIGERKGGLLADFMLTPSVKITPNINATVDFLNLPVVPLKFSEAETTLLLADVRSGIQIAGAEGGANAMRTLADKWTWDRHLWSRGGGYTRTIEGKLIAASFLNNFNKIVQKLRNKENLIR